MKKMICLILALSFLVFTETLISKPAVLKELGIGWVVTGGFDVEGQIRRANNEGKPAGIRIHRDSTGTPDEVSAFCEGIGFCMEVDESGYIVVDWPDESNPQIEYTNDPFGPIQHDEKRGGKNN